MRIEMVPPVPVEQDVTITMTATEAQKLRAVVGGVGGTNGFTYKLFNLLHDEVPGRKLEPVWSPTLLRVVDSFKETS